MRTGKNLLSTALLSCVLCLSFAACGRGGVEEPDRPEGKLETFDTAIQDSQTREPQTREPQTQKTRTSDSEAPEGWGSITFDNDDGAYLLIDDEDILRQIEDSAEGIEAFYALNGHLERCYLDSFSDSGITVFYFDNPGLASKDAVRSLVETEDTPYIFNDIVLGNGARLFFTVSSEGDEHLVYLFEILEGEGVYATTLIARSSADLLACADRIVFAGDRRLSQLLAMLLGESIEETSQRIGSGKTGYVDVPSSWVASKDVTEIDPDAIQYGDGKSSVTMLCITLEERGFSGTADELAQSIGLSAYETYEQSSEVADQNRFTEQLACGLDSYIVETGFASGTYLYQFYIVGDGRVYCIACEGDQKAALDMAYSVIDTFDPSA